MVGDDGLVVVEKPQRGLLHEKRVGLFDIVQTLVHIGPFGRGRFEILIELLVIEGRRVAGSTIG